MDPQGAVIPGSEIQITNVNTGIVTTVQSTGTGNYTTPPLIIGTYNMRLELPGFQVFTAVGIRLDSGQTYRQDVTLQVGDVTETVQVTAVGIQINTTNTEVSSSVDQRYYEDLPTVTTSEMRIPESLLYAVPAFMPLKATNTFPSGTQFMARINGGQRAGFENYLDGASYGEVSGHNQTQERSAPFESIAEMRVIENTFSAQYGHTSGGFVEYTTKSGGSELHGSLYEYFRNNVLDSRGAVAPNAPIVRKNSYGFTVGGPAYIPKVYDGRNKTFFFTNFDQLKFRQSVFQDFLTIPIDPFRQGDFSQLLGGQAGADACGRTVMIGQIFDPASGRDAAGCGGPAGTLVRDAFRNNQVPLRSDVGRNVANLLPPVDRPGILRNHAKESRDRLLDVRTILARVDHNFTDLLKMAVTFNYNDRPRITNCDSVGGCNLPAPLSNAMEQRISTKLLHIQLTHTPKPNFYTHSTFGYDRWILPSTSLSANQGWSSQIGLSGLLDADTGGFPQMNFDQRYSRLGRPWEAQGQATDRWQFLNDTTWLKGRHTVKFGIEYRWERWAVFSKGALAGIYDFSFRNTSAFDATGTPIANTGDPFASLLLGEVSSARFDITARPIFDRDYIAPWINDDIKITDRFTLSLGMRLDFQLGRKERHDTYSTFNPTVQNPLGIPGGIEFAGANGTRRAFQDTDTKTWGPRLGFAYRLGDDSVIRGGYGIYYAGVVMSQFQSSPTFGFSSNPTVTDLTNGRQAAFNWDNPFPQEAIIRPPFIDAGTANGQAVIWMNPDGLTLPRYQNWTASFQHQLQDNLLFDVSYIGNRGTNLIASEGLGNVNQNDPAILGQYSPGLLSSSIDSPGAQAAGLTAPYAGFRGSVAQAIRPFPQFQRIRKQNAANGESSYHALQTKLEKRFSGGFQARFAYTWSKLMNNGAEGGLSGIADGTPQSVFVKEKSLSVDHIPHRVTLNYSFALPIGKGRRFLSNLSGGANAILGGWGIAGVHRYFAGRPLTISRNNIFGGILFNSLLRPDRVAGVSGYRNTDNSNFDIVGDRYLDPGGWQNPTENRLGDSSRVDPVIRGWANFNEDIAIFKDTAISESTSIRLGGNFSNMFNRHVWCDPNTNFSDLGGFGLVSGQCGEARRIELYLKFTF